MICLNLVFFFKLGVANFWRDKKLEKEEECKKKTCTPKHIHVRVYINIRTHTHTQIKYLNLIMQSLFLIYLIVL